MVCGGDVSTRERALPAVPARSPRGKQVCARSGASQQLPQTSRPRRRGEGPARRPRPQAQAGGSALHQGSKLGLSVSGRGDLSTRGRPSGPERRPLQNAGDEAHRWRRAGSSAHSGTCHGRVGLPAGGISCPARTHARPPAPAPSPPPPPAMPPPRHSPLGSQMLRSHPGAPRRDPCPGLTLCHLLSHPQPVGARGPRAQGDWGAWHRATGDAEGWGTHTGVAPRLRPRPRVSSGRRPCRSVSIRDVGDTAPSLGLGRVASGGWGGHLLRTEPAQEVRVPQPPLGVDGHLAPEPVELARKQKAFPRG